MFEKKEYMLFIIMLGLSCFNIPIVIFLYFLNPDFIGIFARTIIPIQCIIIGISLVYYELKNRKNERKNYKVCIGIIKKNKFKILNLNWIKAPVVSYVINGKKYETTASFGINGIISFFLKNKRVKVYYKENNPQNVLFNNNIFIIVGGIFIVIGIFVFITMLFI